MVLLDLHLKLILGLPSEVFEDLLDLRFIIEKEHPRKNLEKSSTITRPKEFPPRLL